MVHSTFLIRAVLVAATSWGALGCNKGTSSGDGEASTPAEDKHAALREKAKKKLTTLKGLADKSKSAPAGVKDASKPLALSQDQYFITTADYLADPHYSRDSKDESPRFESSVLALCSYATTQPPKDADGEYLKKCDGWQYVAVMRTQKWTAPKVNIADKTFQPGVYAGDMLVYKIDSGELAGSYPLEVTNDDSIQRDVMPGETAEKAQEEWQGMARADLSVNLEKRQKAFLEGK